jgi:uncharacterized SAM-binding protein YcdF (DUF218 family)
MIWEFATVAKHVVLPPVSLGWLLLAALWQWRRRPRLARTLTGFALVFGWLMAMPIVGEELFDHLAIRGEPERYSQAQAIVILGGGRKRVLAADGKTLLDSHPGSFTLERLREGARIARRTGLPVLVSAGNPDEKLPTEAAVMKASLEQDFGIVPRWVEDRSRNTAENAQFSARILEAAGIRRVIVVTSGFHLRRALVEFRGTGLEVIPAAAPPVGAAGPFQWGDLLPNASTLMRCHYALHEWLGLAYAEWRAATRPSATVGK